MSGGYTSRDRLKGGASVTISGIATDEPISESYPVTANGYLYHRVDIDTSSTTVAGSITAKLQHSSDGTNWQDTKTVSVTGDDRFAIKLLANDGSDSTHLPLRPRARVVISTTNAGDAVTVDSVFVMQGQ